VEGLEPDTEYWFAVTAHNNGGAGEKAEPVQGRTQPPPVVVTVTPPMVTVTVPGPEVTTTVPQTLAQALAEVSNEIDKAGGGEYTIMVSADETLAPQNLNYGGKTVKITLKSGGSSRTISLNGKGDLFILNTGVTLILEGNITLQGHSDNSSQLISVNNGGTLIVDGGTISGNSSGVSIYGGSLTMNAGAISGHYNGGVYVFAGSFIMNGGIIRWNQGSYGNGGGVNIGEGSFTMNGGIISGNQGGGGVNIGSGSFTMNGGSISGNFTSSTYGGGGVSISSGTFRKTGNSIIYGDTDTTPSANENTALTGWGHAIHWFNGGNTKHRNSTLGAGVNISTDDPVTNWDN
jgi:hypothetical protein